MGLYDRVVKALGRVGIIDVITVMVGYASVAMTLAFYDVPAGAAGMARWAVGPTGVDVHADLGCIRDP